MQFDPQSEFGKGGFEWLPFKGDMPGTIFEDWDDSKKRAVSKGDQAEQRGTKAPTVGESAAELVSDDTLEIVPLSIDKDRIQLRPEMKAGNIPKHPFSMILNGSSGSGKSTLIINLLTKGRFYGPSNIQATQTYFDEIYIFSPTVKSDDLWIKLTKALQIPEERLFNKPTGAALNHIMKEQRKLIERECQGHIELAPKILIMFDDIVARKNFMKEEIFLECFTANRHYGTSVWLCTQAYTRVPKACRQQASAVIFFEGNNSEMEWFVDDFTPPGMGKKCFREVVKRVVRPDHAFLFFNKQVPFEKRYRSNFTHILDLEQCKQQFTQTGRGKRMNNYQSSFTDEQKEKMKRRKKARISSLEN